MIDEITVEGGERMGTSQIRVMSGLHVGQMFRPSAYDSTLQALHRLPQISRADLQVEQRAQNRVGVRIRVHEREPYGVVSLAGRGLFWVDREGYLLEAVEGSLYTPVVTGVSTLSAQDGERIATEKMQRVIKEFFSLAGRLLSRFTELRFREYDLELRAREGWRVLLPLRGLEYHLSQLDSVISALGDSRWRTLDLRFRGEVMLRQ